jgi:hypothetical protein
MFDRLYMPFLGLAALAAIALSLVWPQGLGARSPAPFGRTPEQQRENDAAAQRMSDTRATVRSLQSQAIAPGQ